jgi:hypothetical protein
MNQSTYVEFESESGEYWATECLATLSAAFTLTTKDLKEWHSLMSNQGRAWEILFRLYQVTRATKPDPDALKPWTLPDIAKAMGLTEATVQQEIAGAVRVWKERHAQQQTAPAMNGLTDEEFARLTNFSGGSGLDRDRVDALLNAHGFQHVHDPQFRAELALRIISLREFLASSNMRAQASEILRLEASIHATKSLLVHHQNTISRLIEEDTRNGTSMRSTEIEKTQGKAEALEDRITKMAVSHAKACEAIGADEIDLTARKRIYVETVTHLIDQSRLWNESPDNWRTDGTWTAAEIGWSMEPMGDRGPQYRLDIAMRNCEAMSPENFWDPNFIPKTIPRRVCERLVKMMKHLGPLADDDQFPDETFPDDDSDDDDGDASVVSEEDAASLSGVEDATDLSATGPPPGLGRHRESAEFKTY